MSRSTPKLEHGVDLDGRDGVLLTTPFAQDFIDELKATRDRKSVV